MKKIIVGVLMGALAASAGETTWTGAASDGNWNNANNWSAGVPQAGDTAFFNDATTVSSDIELPGFINVIAAKNKAVNLSGNITGTGPLVLGSYGEKQGTVNLSGVNTFTGDLILSNGYSTVYGKAIGSDESGQVYVVGSGSNSEAIGLMTFNGVTTSRPINTKSVGQWKAGGDSGVIVKFTGANVFNGKWTHSGSYFRSSMGDTTSTATFNAGWQMSSWSLFANRSAVGNEIYVNNEPVTIKYQYSYDAGGGALVLGCKGNYIYDNSSESQIISGAYRFEVDGALDTRSYWVQCKRQIDLTNTKQSVQKVYTRAAYVDSTAVVTGLEGSELEMLSTSTYDADYKVQGAASIKLSGASGTVTMRGVNTSSGTLTLASGKTLNLGNWAGRLVVSDGATLNVTKATFASANTVLDFGSAATLNFDYTGTAAVKELYIDGAKQPSDREYFDGKVYVLPESDAEPVTYTWTGAAENNVFTDGANWEPNFANASDVTSVDILVIGEAAAAQTLSVNEDIRLGSLTVADCDNALTLNGTGALKFGGTENTLTIGKRAVTFNSPVEITGFTNFWDFATGSIVTFGEGLNVSEVVDVTKVGTGKLYLNDVTFDGSYTSTNGNVYVSGDLKCSSDKIFMMHKGNKDAANSLCLYLNNAKIYKDVDLGGCDKTLLQAYGATTNYFYGQYIVGLNGNLRMNCGESGKVGSEIHWAGGIKYNGGGLFLPYTYGTPQSWFYVDTPMPSSVSAYFDGYVQIAFTCTGNCPYMNGPQKGLLRCDVDNVFTDTFQYKFNTANGIVDLNGHNQSIGRYYASDTFTGNTYVKSATPATLKLNTKGTSDTPSIFQGCVSVELVGADIIQNMTGASTSYGDLIVSGSGSKFVFGETGSWANASNVVVSAGSVEFSAAGQIDRRTNVRVSGTGTVKIPEGVTEIAQYLYIEGVRQPMGKYSTGVVTGGGILHCVGDGRGTCLMLR